MPDHTAPHRVLVIESGDDWQAFEVPADWDTDDLDRYLNGRAYGRAAVVNVEPICSDCNGTGLMDSMTASFGVPASCPCGEPDSFLPVGGGEYGGGSI